MCQPSGGSAGVEQEAEHLLAVGALDVSPEVANAAMRYKYGAPDETRVRTVLLLSVLRYSHSLDINVFDVASQPAS